jgi:biotin synthase
MNDVIQELKQKTMEGQNLSVDDANILHETGQQKPFFLMAAAAEIREHFKGKQINLCGIVNAKSGICPENCKFCAQSAHYCTDAPQYPLIKKEEMVEKAVRAKTDGAHMFGIITSGTRIVDEKEWEEIYGAIEGIKALGINPCVSLGMLDYKRAVQLKKAGLFRYHHNLETAKSFFDNICTTHEYQEDIDTVIVA